MRGQGAAMRGALALAGAGAAAALAWAAAFAGLAACHPVALPGDEGWMRLYLARLALSVMTGAPAGGCVLPRGGGLIALSYPLLLAGLALPLAAALWEAAGWRLRLWLLRRRGGHAVLAGPVADAAPLARGLSRLWLVPEGGSAGVFRHSLPLPRVLAGDPSLQPGFRRAGLVVAATPDDLANFRLARLALDAGFRGRLLVRLDGRGLRSLAADALRDRAGGATLVIAAPSVVQMREALHLALPGRFVDEVAGAAPLHLVLCGDGPGIEAMGLLLARQGYGLERAVPHLSVLKLGEGPALATETLPWLGEVLTLTLREVPADDPDRIDSAIAAIAARGMRLAAVCCLSAAPGTAALLAARWERVLGDLGLTVPPLVAIEAGADPAPAGGLVQVVARPGLAEVEGRQARLDARAMAVHAHYLHLMDRAGAGPSPSRQPWATLAERYREDSRAAADHLECKLALCGVVAVAAAAETGFRFSPDEAERLAQVEHARWQAARRVAGWLPGPRDDAAMRHPDLVPYEALDDLAQDKDRDQVVRLPEVLARSAEGLRREWPLRAGAQALPQEVAAERLVAALQALARRHPGHLPLLRTTVAPRDLALAQRVAAAGLPVEVILSDADGPAARTPDAARLRHLARRVRVVADPAERLRATPPALSETGEPHALAPE